MKTKELKKVQTTSLPLPEPIELAKLAAILRPGAEPKAALITAMRFYVEAVFFMRELPSTLGELVTQFGSEERWKEIAFEPVKKAIGARLADTLELDRTKQPHEDEALSYLAQHGLPLKTARAALNNIRRYLDARPTETERGKVMTAPLRESPASVIAKCERVKNGRKVYDIPKFLLEGAVDSAKSRRSENKRKAWKTRQRKSSAQGTD